MSLEFKQIPSNSFEKIAVLESFVAMHKFDKVCILETFLKNTYGDNDLNLNDYSLLQADHPSNAKKRGVCIYYKEALALKMMSIPYLSESLLFESFLSKSYNRIKKVYYRNLSLFYQTSNFYFRIFSIETLI